MKTTSIALSLLWIVGCSPEGLVGFGDGALSQAHEGHGQCENYDVPVAVEDVPGAHIFLEYCTPPESQSNGTLIFMVHTTWHSHYGWDPPNQHYSQVRAALQAGFSVVNIDRLGSGQSSLPPSNTVTIDKVITSIHGVVTKLRDGSLTGTAHSSIVWLGSSFGAMYSWQHEGKYPGDFNGFVLNGIAHRTKLSFAQFAVFQAIISVCDDPVFSQTFSDCGYVVTAPGTKGPLYYDEPNAAPGMITGVNWEDRLLRDVVSLNLLGSSTPLVGILNTQQGPQVIPVPVETSPSQNVSKPTLLVIGENDPISCGGPEGYICNETTVYADEAPYYSNAPVFDVFVPEDTGHVINLHQNGPDSMDFENQWILDNIVN